MVKLNCRFCGLPRPCVRAGPLLHDARADLCGWGLHGRARTEPTKARPQGNASAALRHPRSSSKDSQLGLHLHLRN